MTHVHLRELANTTAAIADAAWSLHYAMFQLAMDDEDRRRVLTAANLLQLVASSLTRRATNLEAGVAV